MPTIDRYGGLRFHFYSEEEDRAHVHVESQDGVAKVWLVPEIELEERGNLRPKDMQTAMERIQEKRDEYLAKWRGYFG